MATKPNWEGLASEMEFKSPLEIMDHVSVAYRVRAACSCKGERRSIEGIIHLVLGLARLKELWVSRRQASGKQSPAFTHPLQPFLTVTAQRNLQLQQALKTFGSDVAIAFSGAEDVALVEYAHLTGRPYRVFRWAQLELLPGVWGYAQNERNPCKASGGLRKGRRVPHAAAGCTHALTWVPG